MSTKENSQNILNLLKNESRLIKWEVYGWKILVNDDQLTQWFAVRASQSGLYGSKALARKRVLEQIQELYMDEKIYSEELEQISCKSSEISKRIDELQLQITNIWDCWQEDDDPEQKLRDLRDQIKREVTERERLRNVFSRKLGAIARKSLADLEEYGLITYQEVTA